MNLHIPRIQTLLFLLLLLSLALPARPARAETVVSDVQVEYAFGSQITFTASVDTTRPIREVAVSFRSQGDTQTQMGEADLDRFGKISYIYAASPLPLRAFAQTEYWFTFTLEDGEIINSPVYTFFYEDNRFDWHTLETPPFQVFWYEGDAAFGQSVLDIANEGLRRAQQLLPFSHPHDIKIYVYATFGEMRATLLLGGLDWIAGHAQVDLGVMAVSLPVGPEQRLEMERQIPHELMHILLYQMVGPAYENLPVWFNEGLASTAELYPNPEYHVLMENAIEKKLLIPMSSLCESYPLDASGAQLFYAQSNSFVRYLYHQYGSQGLEELVMNYANGASCENGVETVMGVPLRQLEEQWLQASYQTEPIQEAADGLLPWVVLVFASLVIPFGLTAALFIRRPRKTEENILVQ